MAVIAKSYARLGWQNLINFGIAPFEFTDPSDYDTIDQGDVLVLENMVSNFKNNITHELYNETKGLKYLVNHRLSPRQIEVYLAGGVINYFKMSHQGTLSIMDPND